MVSSVTQVGASAVQSAIKNASEKTGVGFDFLVKMARRESALDPSAKAATSSAAGLFQFIEQTWLGAVKAYGARHGLSAAASHIDRTADGRFTVENAERRTEILNLRFDAKKASALAAELTRENKTALEDRLGRPVGGADLYAAHFLGVAGASKLLSAPASAKAADLLPAAATANQPVFFEKNGAKKTVAAVIQSFEKTFGVMTQSLKSAVSQSTGPSASTPSPTQSERLEPAPSTRRRDVQLNSPLPVDTDKFFQDLMAAAPGVSSSGFDPLALLVLQTLDPTALRKERADG